ncbi:hypothetical protein MDAP_001751 [Mitosporidium daphniae]
MNATFRKAAPRRTHRERCAPADRSRFGILERHKDYKQRAKSYHLKAKRLNAMKQAARFKNPDEFYFAMQRSKIIQIDKLQKSRMLPVAPLQHICFDDDECGDQMHFIKPELAHIAKPGLESMDPNRPACVLDPAQSHGKMGSFDDADRAEELVPPPTPLSSPSSAVDDLFAFPEFEQDGREPIAIHMAVSRENRELNARLVRQEALGRVAQKMRTRRLASERKEKVGTTTCGAPVFKFAQVRKR